tara:strand:- start:3957 stop:4166 length:210 start_codon:yes stop_codon:yes gene_type:complete
MDNNITSKSETKQDYYIKKYKESLNQLEKQALFIAENNLETSFCIEKSIGFLQFLKSFDSHVNDDVLQT